METMENNLPSATHQEKAKKMKKLRRWQIAISLLGVAIIVWGVIEVICLFLSYSQTETSNDAQIEQYVSPINLRASGYIDKIYFTEHQEVHKGDTLLVLDDREYKIRVMEAEAALKDAFNATIDFLAIILFFRSDSVTYFLPLPVITSIRLTFSTSCFNSSGVAEAL